MRTIELEKSKTVHEFFTNYTGTSGWMYDVQTLNTTLFDDIHAQDDGQEGKLVLEKLKQAKDIAITITRTKFGDSVDYDFEIPVFKNDKIEMVDVSVQAIC
jgi:hypothetical protein